jgi:nucleoside-diphosphate-sugar epimerase
VTRIIGEPAARNEVFNITYGQSRSIKELLDVMRERFPHLRVRHEPVDRLMPERGTLSVDKARRVLGYEPEYPIERGFHSYIDWYEKLFAEHPELFAKT